MKYFFSAKENRFSFVHLIICGISSVGFFSCGKTLTNPEPTVQVPASSSNSGNTGNAINFSVSESQVTLIQYNNANTIVHLKWEQPGVQPVPGTLYSVEFSLVEFDFISSAIIDSTHGNSLDITVEHLNQHMTELIEAGFSDMIKMRIRANIPGSKTPIYSNAVALNVTTYKNFYEYSPTQILHLPGNYQNWKVVTAPDIVSASNNGVFEGYVNFTQKLTQFLVVKGDDWNPLNTFYDIGGSKIGFGGNIFNVNEEPGIYKIKINTNTNKWEYVRINSWEIYGSALPDSLHTDHVMKFNSGTVSWTCTVPLVKGKFRIRANDGNTISFGHIHNKGYMQPDYAGEDFEILIDGLYTITLNLQASGNYGCSVTRRDLAHAPL